MAHILENLSYFFALITVVGAIFNANLNIKGFYIWLVANTFHAFFNFYFHHYGYFFLDIAFILTNIHGISMMKGKKKELLHEY